jgi:hypothetical protein
MTLTTTKIKYDTQQKDTQRNGSVLLGWVSFIMLKVLNNPLMPSVIMLNVVMLCAVAPTP